MSPAGKVLWQDSAGDLVVLERARLDRAFVAFVEQQYFGTSGVRYRRLNVAQELKQISCPRYISVELKGQIVGSYVIASIDVYSAQQSHKGFYRGLLSVEPKVQQTGIGRTLVTCVMNRLEALARRDGSPTLSWGCIEGDNQRSLRALRSGGLQNLGKLESSTVYQQWPRERLSVEVLNDAASDQVREAVLESQSDCQLQLVSSPGTDYFAVTDAQGIVLGSRVTRTQVELETIGGAWDILDRYLLRFSAAARRRFDPDCFTYLRLSDLVIRPGLERLWPQFLSSLLAQNNAYLAMMVTDPESRLHRQLGHAGQFRPWSRIARHSLHVVGTSWNWGTGSPENISGKPCGLQPIGF